MPRGSAGDGAPVKVDGGKARDTFLKTPPAGVRLFLFYGPDAGGGRSAAAKLASTLQGEDGERVQLTQAQLKDNGSLLADEASAISMFGGTRVIWVDQIAGPGAVHAVRASETLLAGSAVGDPVILVAGDLKATHALVKLAAGHEGAAAIRFDLPSPADALRIAGEMCAEAGLDPTDGVRAILAETILADRNVAAREVEKYALYLDASPDAPKRLDETVVDLLGAAFSEGDFSTLSVAVSSGRPDAALTEHDRLLADGKASVGQVRAVQRRYLQILERQSGGRGWGPNVSDAELRVWTPKVAERALERLRQLEVEQKSSGTAGADLLTAESLAGLARFAAGKRR